MVRSRGCRSHHVQRWLLDIPWTHPTISVTIRWRCRRHYNRRQVVSPGNTRSSRTGREHISLPNQSGTKAAYYRYHKIYSTGGNTERINTVQGSRKQSAGLALLRTKYTVSDSCTDSQGSPLTEKVMLILIECNIQKLQSVPPWDRTSH